MTSKNNYDIRLSKGPAAARVYLSFNDSQLYNCCQLTLDWSYDGLYFKYYNNDWIILSIGPKTEKHQIYNLDTDDKIKIFKVLANYFLNNLQNYSTISDASLLKLKEIMYLL